MDRKTYSNILRSQYGPSVVVLDRLISFWGKTWDDWARAYQYLKWGGDYQAKDWQMRYEQMLKMPIGPGAEARLRDRNQALMKRVEKIADRHEAKLDQAMVSALELWADRAEAGGVDENMKPRALTAAGRRKVAEMAMVAEQTPAYKPKRKR